MNDEQESLSLPARRERALNDLAAVIQRLYTAIAVQGMKAVAQTARLGSYSTPSRS